MVKEIADNIKLLSMNVEGLLFEGMWDMPEGVTLNSYIVKGDKTAIIDGFCVWDGVPETLFKLLEEADVTLESIKYLIINHMEPDHTGWIADFRKLHSDFEIYCTKEAAALLNAFYGHTENIHEITDGEVLDLGGGSGILSIAALKRGAAQATAVDIDDKCLTVAYDNASLNSIGKDTYTVKVGDILSDEKVQAEIGGGYDIVLANIVSDVIIALAPRVHSLVKEGGLFLCAGIIDTRAEEVKGKLLEAGLTILEERSSEGWFAFTCQ